MFTDIGWYVDPTGTIAVSEVGVAAMTFALTAPKNTILFAGVVLKPLPLIVTVEPMFADNGENDVITGACAFAVIPKTKNINAENIVRNCINLVIDIHLMVRNTN